MLRSQASSPLCGSPPRMTLISLSHADPEVARYWDGQTYTGGEMRLRLARSHVDAYIVEADREPVGYLQAYIEEAVPSVGSLDMFLVPSARDRGLGADAAATLARWLVDAGNVQRLTVDPYLSNTRAIRAWTKAGFQPVEKREPDSEHTAPWLRMVYVSHA